jgi:hypothetical protein
VLAERFPDSDRLVFEVKNEEGFLSFGFVEQAMFAVAIDVPFGRQRLAATWSPWKYKVWGTSKDKRSLKTPDVANALCGALFIKPQDAGCLIDGFESAVELLPIEVDGMPWFLMHCFEARAVLNEPLSDYLPPPTPHPWQRYWIVHRAVLHDDPQLYPACFCIQGRGPTVYCGAGFRSRVQAMGLAGLQFKEVGHFER